MTVLAVISNEGDDKDSKQKKIQRFYLTRSGLSLIFYLEECFEML